MKRYSFFVLFCAIHIIGLVLYIYKYNVQLQYSYRVQALEKKHHDLLQQKQHLQECYCMLQDSQKIHQYAQQELGMIPLSLQSIHRLPS